MSIAGSTTIRLTVAGVAATGRAEREIGLFLAVVRHAVILQRDYDPPANQPDLQPVLTAADMAVPGNAGGEVDQQDCVAVGPWGLS